MSYKYPFWDGNSRAFRAVNRDACSMPRPLITLPADRRQQEEAPLFERTFASGAQLGKLQLNLRFRSVHALVLFFSGRSGIPEAKRNPLTNHTADCM